MTLGISTVIEELSPAKMFGPVGGATARITDVAYLEGELVGAKDLTRGLTQAPSDHLDRVFRGGLKTAAAGAIQFTRPTTPTGPKVPNPKLGL